MHNGDDLTYNLRAKKAVLFKPDNGFLGLNLKGRLLIDKEFKPVTFSHIAKQKYASCQSCPVPCDLINHTTTLLSVSACAPWSLQTKTAGAVELAWTILDLKQGQDVRLKVGYELYDKVIRPSVLPAASFMHEMQNVPSASKPPKQLLPFSDFFMQRVECMGVGW